MLSRGRVVLAVVVLAVLAVVVATATNLLSSGSDTAAPSPGVSTTACVAEPGSEMRDVDTDDSPEYPWAREPGQKVVVQFETGDLSPRYAGFVEEGARLWSQGPCVDAVAVARCDDGANCTTIEEEVESPDGSTDGESAGRQNDDDIRVSNRLTFYTELLDQNTDNGALATVVHEMGHALGLVHRNDSDAMLNAVTGPDTDPNPDEIDFYNLTVLYGTPQG